MIVVKPETTVTISIKNPETIALVKYEAFHARIGGRSAIYKNYEERMLNLPTNQLSGQAGNISLNILVFEDDYCIDLYKKSREPFHINPYQGDNGMDIVDTHIDIKNSFTLNKAKKANKKTVYINNYNLVVRPEEFHPDWVYVAALSEKLDDNELKTYLIGWAWSSDFPKEVNKEGELKGAFTIRHDSVRPFPLPDIFPTNLKEYIRKTGVVEGVF